MAAAARFDPVTAEDIALGVGGYTVTNPGGGQLANSRVNLSTFALIGSATFNPGAVPSHSLANAQVDCLGARIGYPCLVSFNGILGHLNNALVASVTVDDKVNVTLLNNDDVSSLTVGPGTLRVFCFPVPLI